MTNSNIQSIINNYFPLYHFTYIFSIPPPAPHLSSKRFGENQYISNHSSIRNNELIWLTDSCSHASNSAPRIHNSLSSANSGSSLKSTVFKSPHDQRNDNVPFLLRHLGRNCEKHQHVVAWFPRISSSIKSVEKKYWGILPPPSVFITF